MIASRVLRSIRLGTSSRFSSTIAGRLEKPPLRGQHRYSMQNAFLAALTISLGSGFLLNTFFWLPRKKRMNEFFANYDDAKRAKELIEGGILDLVVDDLD
ncbi:uncharacterized protein LOC128386179 [Panonychus citri]|uniref:uncharacterized protein LOC128386179 n=1 Tax=Panonychus citri TaxID=50023 RepID=UPI002307EFE7|nr:uncharacterized protein LOC128386179 [Panonychus citri]